MKKLRYTRGRGIWQKDTGLCIWVREGFQRGKEQWRLETGEAVWYLVARMRKEPVEKTAVTHFFPDTLWHWGCDLRCVWLSWSLEYQHLWRMPGNSTWAGQLWSDAFPRPPE